MFHTGDKLAHPSHGGCIVSDICIQNRGGEAVEYLVLIPQNEPGVKVMVPLSNTEKVGLRRIISTDAADRLLHSFAQPRDLPAYESNFAKRRQAYQEIIKSGPLESLVTLIQELTRQPKLNSGDKEMLPRAQKKLFSEIALAKGMEFQQVLEIAAFQMKPAGGAV